MVQKDLASAIGFFEPKVADAIGCTCGGGEMTGEALGAIVGREMHLPAALDHLMRKRLGREKMPARAACRE